jgi:bromodomain adjacent to zinc finger domain protein 1A
VIQVFPPNPLPQASTSQASSSASSLSDEETLPIHKIAEDLKVSVKDAMERDDPSRYYYKVQILEEDKQTTGKASEKSKGKEANKSKYSGSLMDVRCTDMR